MKPTGRRAKTWLLGVSVLGTIVAAETASLESIAGREWVLREWDTGEPAPAQPEVTFAYRDGRAAGTSGCNRYTAAVTAGEGPGEISVGPAAGTRMACPEPSSSVEARFLKQLAAGKKLGFQSGQLTVSYEKGASAWGRMLFAERISSPRPAPRP